MNKRYSLTLLVILLAVAAIVLPNAVPTVHAAGNTNLFVTVVHSTQNNNPVSPQIVEVVVNDPNIKKLDQLYGMPSVTVNGKNLVMMQAIDGNWYGYFSDRNQSITIDKISSATSKGLNFGYFCGTSGDTFAANLKTGLSFAETVGYTVSSNVTGSSDGITVANPIGNSCLGATSINGNYVQDVVKHYKAINTNPNGFGLGLDVTAISKVWPIIQLYDFSATPSITVDYQKAGGDQIVNLTFDGVQITTIKK